MKRDNQHGSATIEAIVAFTGFLFVIFTLLNIINFCRAQMLISNAIDTVAKELSQYSYFYKMSGLQKFDSSMQENADVGANNINEVIGTVDSLYSTLAKTQTDVKENYTDLSNGIDEGTITAQSIQNALTELQNDTGDIKNAYSKIGACFDNVSENPMTYMRSIVAIAGNEALDAIKSHAIAAPLAKSFMIKHFGATRQEADQRLKDLGIKDGIDGINFGMSTLFSSSEKNNELVHIVAYYKLEVVQLFEWMTLELPLCKEAFARAWLAGDDVQKTVNPLTGS